MSFGNPLFLWGALAALLPILIHLFDRRRPRPHPFGAIGFVLRSQKRTASRLKLKRLLLYSLRTLLLLAVPLALARPECRSTGATQSLTQGPAATAIVLDASLSMRFDDGRALFEEGRTLAIDALTDLLPEEPATVLVCTGNVTPPGAPGFERSRLRQLLDDAQATYAASDMSRCLDLAARALEESPMPGKRLVLVSDFTQGAFRLEAPPPAIKGPDGKPVQPEVVLRDAAQGREELPNHAIVDLKVEPALNVGPRAYAFSFTVRNFSSQPVKDLEASLKLGDRVLAKGFLELPAGGTAQKTLTHRFDEGGTFSGEVALTPDALAEDDRRPFVISVPRALKALIVNGAPSAVRYRDEAFFVQAALDAPGSPVEAHLLDVDAAMREKLEDYDLLLLLNVPAPSSEVAERLETFVREGGGLFVSMGDQVEPEAYNTRLGKLLPRPLRLVKTAALPDEADVEMKSARLTELTLTHPVLAPFAGPAREGLVGARFYKYMLLEGGGPAEGEEARVLGLFADGAPALAVARRDKGRVALLTSTVDRDWSDLPIRTGFLPLMQRLAAYLAGALEERDELRGRVGAGLTLRPGNREQVAKLRAPSGDELDVRTANDGTVQVPPLVEPGIYTALNASGEPVPSQSFPALLETSESDLSRLDADALTASFGEASVRRDAGPGERPQVPVWTWLLVTAVLAFFFEGLLLRS